MRNMFKAIKRLINEHDDIQVVYPVHLNPAVREVADEVLGNNSRIHLIEPLGVVDFHNFASRAHIILTDSGGVQEEAPSLGVPVLVLRDTTERPEGIEAGTLKLAGTDEETIYKLAKELLTNQGNTKKCLGLLIHMEMEKLLIELFRPFFIIMGKLIRLHSHSKIWKINGSAKIDLG